MKREAARVAAGEEAGEEAWPARARTAARGVLAGAAALRLVQRRRERPRPRPLRSECSFTHACSCPNQQRGLITLSFDALSNDQKKVCALSFSQGRQVSVRDKVGELAFQWYVHNTTKNPTR